VSPSVLFLAIVALIVVELYHLKWIWLEYWSCSKCGVKNLECRCRPRWQLYL
jgi:hypothetical protein